VEPRADDGRGNAATDARPGDVYADDDGNAAAVEQREPAANDGDDAEHDEPRPRHGAPELDGVHAEPRPEAAEPGVRAWVAAA